MIYRFLPDAIYALEPNAHFRINGNFTFENLTWEPHVDKAIIPTEQAIAQKANELEAAYPMVLLREERDKRLSEVDWWTSRALDGIELTQEQKDYRQALRDLPSTASPQMDESGFNQIKNVTWPTKPE